MNQIARLKKAQDFYTFWHPRLSPKQAKSLENIQKACNEIVEIGSHIRMNAASVGKYCKEHYGPPASQTISNMTALDESGNKVHVYLDYLRLRDGENRRGALNSIKAKNISAPSYLDLANGISDMDTRTWVKQLIGEFELEKKSCDFLQEQVKQLSREVGGVDFAGAISKGPTDKSPMSLQTISMNSSVHNKHLHHLIDAIRAICRIPTNRELPYLQLNDQGALVYDDDVSGTVMILSPKQWQAFVSTIEEVEP
nr:hypothetical protein [uncultured Desulfuromonas sp.]